MFKISNILENARFLFTTISQYQLEIKGMKSFLYEVVRMKKIIELLQTIVALLQSNKSANKRWLTPQELEIEYGLMEDTMSKYRMLKKVPYSKIGTKLIRYDKQKIDAWLENHNVLMQEEG